jgi:hypothetical protein
MDLSKYHFTYNASAHFATLDKFPNGLIEEITKSGLEGFEALCWALEELSTQGELVRRDMGYDKGPIIKAEQAKTMLLPYEIMGAKQLILDAIIRGINVPDESKEIDEVLMELQKKTESE